ncbi:TonB-dependent receptor [Mucilaginibacter sp. X4EP1]|uniref:TonB-dependent receptor n=1 Tax=Mucilaginibacter sp. X4EP1 TaxID=2723092 RepID=UPI00216A466D|nr:TonB-dependent receptor [Mucilaginibacter sp. X4EP1]MCS3815191.1 outer membrane cobalamin receptor [Mucilaginibacter sp. X4EP1]
MHLFKKIAYTALLLIGGTSFGYAQKIYKGKVIDELTGEPIDYACVCTKSANKTTVTDKFGNFQLSLPTDTATLYVSFIGYTTQTIKTTKTDKRFVVVLRRGAIDLKEVQISPSLNNNSFHTLSSLDLNLRPVNSSQDLMRLVPGLFIAQHMGGGKAEQIFVRGFDADHGTDVNVSVDDMPVNMVSHIHGQGYADLHFLIPETIADFDYGKGPYYTEKGDFTTAGYLNFTTKDVLDKSVVSLEYGRFNTFRGMAILNLLDSAAKKHGENWYIAGEYNYTNGPFTFAEHYKRFNAFSKYTKQLNEKNKLTFSASAFTTTWRASGEIPERAVAANTTAVDANGNPVIIPEYSNPIGRFGTIDSAQGGKTSRFNFIAKLNTDLGNNLNLENEVYYTHYNFLLHVNTSFFAEDSLGGEQQQNQDRDMFGYNGKLSKRHYLGNVILTSTVGLGTRFDRTYGTERSDVTEQYQLIDYIEQGNINQNNTSVYVDETLQSGKWLFNAGARLDYFNFNYHDTTKNDVVVSPKFNIQYTANDQVQFYLKTGKGFHSNNGITVIGNNNFETLPAAYGADLGLNWKPIPHLYINTALWYLYLQQEFVYDDDGNIVAGGKTKRYGVDFSARYQLTDWLFADLNINLAHPRLADSAKNTGYLALAPTFTSTGGLDFKFKNGINGGLSYRYMHSRAGNNTGTLNADGYYVTDLKINYTQKRYEIGLTIENLFNTQWNEFEAEEVSQLKGETAPVDQMSFTPGTPFAAKLRVAIFF